MGHILEASLEPFSDCALSRAHEVTHSVGHIVGVFSDTAVSRAHEVTHSVGHLVWALELVSGADFWHTMFWFCSRANVGRLCIFQIIIESVSPPPPGPWYSTF